MAKRDPKRAEDLVLIALRESAVENVLRGVEPGWESVLALILRLRGFQPPLNRGQVRDALQRLAAAGYVEVSEIPMGHTRKHYRLAKRFLGKDGGDRLRKERKVAPVTEGGPTS